MLMLTTSPPELIYSVLCQLNLFDLLRVRQTCWYLSAHSRSLQLWLKIAQRLIRDEGLIWPHWARPLHILPAETVEELVIRAFRLRLMERSRAKRETRISFENLIDLSKSAPVWLSQLQGRWLLLQNKDLELELCDMETVHCKIPAFTFPGLEGIVDGVETSRNRQDIEIVLSTSSYRSYVFVTDLPFKAEIRSVQSSLLLVKSFDGYSKLRAKHGSLLGFTQALHHGLSAYVVDYSTLTSTRLELGSGLFKLQSVIDISIRDEVVVVARQRHLDLYSTCAVRRALTEKFSTSRTTPPFQSILYPHCELASDLTIFSSPPPCFDAPQGSIVLVSFFDLTYFACILEPQKDSRHGHSQHYSSYSTFGVGANDAFACGVYMGKETCRFACLSSNHEFSFHFERLPEIDEDGRVDDRHSHVTWGLPETDSCIPRSGCVSIDEGTGVCVIGLASGQIVVADLVPRLKSTTPMTLSLENKAHSPPHPNPRWPELPPWYFWDGFYRGVLSDSDTVDEIAPGWSTAVNHYFPWRNRPETYGGILWFVTSVMGLPGPAKVVLFSTQMISYENSDWSNEVVNVDGSLFLVRNSSDYSDVRVWRLVEGTTMEDVISHLMQGERIFNLALMNEDWMYDWTSLCQHWHWYMESGRSSERQRSLR